MTLLGVGSNTLVRDGGVDGEAEELLDADIDARNPRTRMRHIPAGLLSARFAWGFVLASVLVFLLAARALNPLCLKLAPVALAVVFFYSFTKRFTTFSHLILGLSLGIAPAAAWIAVRGTLDPRILWLTAAVMFWTAGFDIIYSCQDYEFDSNAGLFSLPRRFGLPRAARVAVASRAARWAFSRAARAFSRSSRSRFASRASRSGSVGGIGDEGRVGLRRRSALIWAYASCTSSNRRAESTEPPLWSGWCNWTSCR